MTLQFSPYPILQQPQRPSPSEYVQQWVQGLNQIGDTFAQGQADTANRRRQAMLDRLLMQEEKRKQTQFQYDYGSPPQAPVNNPAMMQDVPAGPARMGLVDQWNAFSKRTPLPSFNNAGGPPPAPILGRKNIEWQTEQDYKKAQTKKLLNDIGNPDISYQAKEYLDENNRARVGRFNPKTGLIEKNPNDVYAPQTARGETAGNLRKEFIDRPEVKDFQTINTQVKSMDSLLANALSGNMDNKLALDQALITIYNKINDPSSVVRESEYARTPENLPIADRISGAIQKLQQGGAGLTDEDRKALVVGAKIIANERGGTYQKTRSGYVDLARQMSLEPSLITATMPDFSPYSFSKSNVSRVRVTNGRETLEIDANDLADAQRDGYQVMR